MDKVILFKTRVHRIYAAGNDEHQYLIQIEDIGAEKFYSFDLFTGKYLGTEECNIPEETLRNISAVLKMEITNKYSLWKTAIIRINDMYKDSDVTPIDVNEIEMAFEKLYIEE